MNAKGMGVPVEYWYPFKYEDSQLTSGKSLTWQEYNRLSKEDKDLCVLKFNTSYVFNGSLVEGLPDLEKRCSSGN